MTVIDFVDLMHPGPLVDVDPIELRHQRLALGLTIDEVAEAADVDPRTVVRLEDWTGCHSARVRWPQARQLTIRKLARVYGVDAEVLTA